MSVAVIAVVLTALVFDFTNGFHDTANAMATSIATGALRPRVAVVLAGVLNLLGAFLSVQVALTISSGLVDEARITPAVIFGGLVGAILWNLVTWLLGLPSSSSHALFGGLIGATWVFAGTGAINFSTVAGKVLLPLALSPVVAGVVALSATWIAYRSAARYASRLDRVRPAMDVPRVEQLYCAIPGMLDRPGTSRVGKEAALAATYDAPNSDVRPSPRNITTRPVASWLERRLSTK